MGAVEVERALRQDEQEIGRLRDALDEMKRLILDYKIPEGIVRRYTSYQVAEFIFNDERVR